MEGLENDLKSSLDDAIRETDLMSALLEFQIEELKPQAINEIGKVMCTILRYVPGMEHVLHNLVESLQHEKSSIQLRSVAAILRIAIRTIKGPYLLKTENDLLIEFKEIFNIEPTTFDAVFNTLKRLFVHGKMYIDDLIRLDILQILLIVIRSSHIKTQHVRVISLVLYYIFLYEIELSAHEAKTASLLFQTLMTIVDVNHIKWIIRGLRDLTKRPDRIMKLYHSHILNIARTLIVHKDNQVKKYALKLFSEISTNVYIKSNPKILHIPLNNAHNLLIHADEDIRKYSLEILYQLTLANNGLAQALVDDGLIPSIIFKFKNNNHNTQYIVAKLMKNITVYANESALAKLSNNYVIPLLWQCIPPNSKNYVCCILSSIYNMLKKAREDTEYVLQECNMLVHIKLMNWHEDDAVQNLSIKLQKDFIDLFEEIVCDE